MNEDKERAEKKRSKKRSIEAEIIQNRSVENAFDSEQELLTLGRGVRQTHQREQLSDNCIGGEDPLTGLDPFLSPDNVARYLDVSRKFVYELMARREIESVSVGGRLKRIRLSALETWLGRRNKRRSQV